MCVLVNCGKEEGMGKETFQSLVSGIEGGRRSPAQTLVASAL